MRKEQKKERETQERLVKIDILYNIRYIYYTLWYIRHDAFVLLKISYSFLCVSRSLARFFALAAFISTMIISLSINRHNSIKNDYGTTHGLMSQISLAYWSMVLSELNLPEVAVDKMEDSVQPSWFL